MKCATPPKLKIAAVLVRLKITFLPIEMQGQKVVTISYLRSRLKRDMIEVKIFYQKS